MKTFNITNRTSRQAKNAINEILATHETYKKSYFFHSNSSASGRRSNEKKFASNSPDYTFIKGEDTIVVSRTYSESCNNVYYTLYVSINSESKTITAIKKLQS